MPRKSGGSRHGPRAGRKPKPKPRASPRKKPPPAGAAAAAGRRRRQAPGSQPRRRQSRRSASKQREAAAELARTSAEAEEASHRADRPRRRRPGSAPQRRGRPDRPSTEHWVTAEYDAEHLALERTPARRGAEANVARDAAEQAADDRRHAWPQTKPSGGCRRKPPRSAPPPHTPPPTMPEPPADRRSTLASSLDDLSEFASVRRTRRPRRCSRRSPTTRSRTRRSSHPRSRRLEEDREPASRHVGIRPDTASLLRELSSLGLEDDPAGPLRDRRPRGLRSPAPRQIAPQPPAKTAAQGTVRPLRLRPAPVRQHGEMRCILQRVTRASVTVDGRSSAASTNQAWCSSSASPKTTPGRRGPGASVFRHHHVGGEVRQGLGTDLVQPVQAVRGTRRSGPTSAAGSPIARPLGARSSRPCGPGARSRPADSAPTWRWSWSTTGR